MAATAAESLIMLLMLAGAVLIAFSVVVIVVRRLNRNRQERLPGHCRFYGYNLRATPDRCPECGAEPPTRPPDYYSGV